MCKAKTPDPVTLPTQRALARTPQYAVTDRDTQKINSTEQQRVTIVNPSGGQSSAPTAQLGGTAVVLGG
jgi:hypothetical protein